MLREFVADNNQLEIGKLVLLFQFRLQRGKGLDNAHQILVRTDAARIKQKGVSHQIAFREDLTVGVRSVTAKESFINSVVHNLYAGSWDAKQFLDIALGV